MVLVFFIYGLAFFLLGFSIFLYPKKNSALRLADNLWLVAGFGLLHGLNEWIDMVLLIQPHFDTFFLKLLRSALLPASFVFLILFGVRSVRERENVYLKALPVLLLVSSAVFIAAGKDYFLAVDVVSRYLLGFPGTMLTAFAFYTYLPEFEKTKSPVLIGSLKLVAASFFMYGIFSGLVVQKADFFPASVFNYQHFINTFGLPVQVFRALCAVTAMFGIMRLLKVFWWEVDKSLRESNERYRTLAEAAQDIIFVIDRDNRIEYLNAFGAGLIGFDVGEIIGAHALSRFPALFDTVGSRLRSVLETGAPLYVEEKTHFPKRDVLLGTLLVPLRDDSGEVYGVMGVSRDITEQKKLEEQLRQSQKMQAVGQIAGGVAHDFNNILSVIVGHAELLQMEIQEDHPLRQHVDQIVASSERAANLTRGLLAFSRKQVMKTRPLDINIVIENFLKLIRRIIGEDISIKTIFTSGKAMVQADPGQVEQVLINLATNARDAMPNGGTLTIETAHVELNPEFIIGHGYGESGNYVLLSLSDSGCGMNSATREKIFDPFFTTKEIGKGTGLGLAIVYGIVKQHKGYITVYSSEGKGTCVKVYLPASEASEQEATSPRKAEAPRGGTETILLVEDDRKVREIERAILEKFGYTVIEAKDGEEALAEFVRHQDSIHLALLDVVMPGMNGKAVYDEMQKIRAGVKSIFTSGYTADAVRQKALLDEHMHFLSKPVSHTEILQKVREVLDDRRPG